MDARDRFLSSLAETVSDEYYVNGLVYLSRQKIDALAKEQRVPEAEVRATLDLLDERALLMRQEGGHSYSDGIGLLLKYEQSADRRLFWQRNELRREILRLAAIAYDENTGDPGYRAEGERFVDVPWAEAYAASKTLEYLGLLEMHEFMGQNFDVRVTPNGRELLRDARGLAQELPVSAAEDDAAGTDVAPDALRDLILSVEDLLGKRGWIGAARELSRGDDQYRECHWTDAVREYYSALESGLKHRLDEASIRYGEGAALKDLAKLAASQDLVPTNYQSLFGFADSIRSPRSHGAGSKLVEVEVGRAEALLMGNHTRALLLYLGQRPE